MRSRAAATDHDKIGARLGRKPDDRLGGRPGTIRPSTSAPRRVVRQTSRRHRASRAARSSDRVVRQQPTRSAAGGRQRTAMRAAVSHHALRRARARRCRPARAATTCAPARGTSSTLHGASGGDLADHLADHEIREEARACRGGGSRADRRCAPAPPRRSRATVPRRGARECRGRRRGPRRGAQCVSSTNAASSTRATSSRCDRLVLDVADDGQHAGERHRRIAARARTRRRSAPASNSVCSVASSRCD